MAQDAQVYGTLRSNPGQVRRARVQTAHRHCGSSCIYSVHGKSSNWNSSIVSNIVEPEVAIQPIRNAILRLDPSSSCFTSSHVVFAHLCLSARAFSSALPVLDKDIFHFPSPSDKSLSLPLPCSDHDTSSTLITTGSGLSDKLVYKDHLKYFLYGAMLYLGVKNWERALLFLEIVIATPTNNTVSMVQVEAYKKYVLVGLLLEGRVSSHSWLTNSKILMENQLVITYAASHQPPSC